MPISAQRQAGGPREPKRGSNYISPAAQSRPEPLQPIQTDFAGDLRGRRLSPFGTNARLS